MAKKVSGLNMLILVGGLILLFLFFWGAYKVKDGFDGSCPSTTSTAINSSLYENKEDSITDITNACKSMGKLIIKGTTAEDVYGDCSYSNLRVSNCNSRQVNGKWKSICSCGGTLDST